MSLALDRRHFLGATALVGGALATPGWAKKSAREIGHAWPAIQTMLDGWTSTKKVAAGGAAVARGLDQADFLVSGTLALDSPLAVTPDTLFRCYSMTKPVTGMAAMILIDDGKLKLDQNIADFMPGWANPRVLTDPQNSLKSRPSQTPVTVRTLMTHTAGLGYSIVTKGPLLDAYVKEGITGAVVSRHDLPGFPKSVHAPSLEAMADRLAGLPLISDPGYQWSYSVGLDVLGRLIEVVSGMPFDVFLKKRLFDPLGMTSSFFTVPASETHRLTTNYFELPTGPFPIDPGKDSVYSDPAPMPFGGGGLVSTMRDFDRFLAMLMGEGALGKTRIMGRTAAIHGMSNMMHPDTKNEGYAKGQGFGAGGRVTIAEKPGSEGVGTFGWGGAASTIAWVDRKRGVRASGWTQLMTRGRQKFPEEFGAAVYASL
jgi:CubicO group peptidase (beta-lactamase class C family)